MRPGTLDPAPDAALHGLVGVGDRRAVGLLGDHEIDRGEPVERDEVRLRGEGEGEGEIVGQRGGGLGHAAVSVIEPNSVM